ncbi:transglutaminase family protein [Vibrio metschnikovii]
MQGITFPTQFLLEVQWPDEAPLYLNPFPASLSRNTCSMRGWLVIKALWPACRLSI